MSARRIDVDKWGRSDGGLVAWRGVNCLRSCVAALLGAANIEAIPDTAGLARDEGWLEGYSERLVAATGYRLEEMTKAECLHPRNSGTWIAALSGVGGSLSGHAVVCRNGVNVAHDPAGGAGGRLHTDLLSFGLRLVPANAPRRDRCGAPIR
jgi:hypothetical protein